MAKLYYPGMYIGPEKILFKKEIPMSERKNRNKPEGIFVCPECGKDFRAQVGNVVSGNTKRCSNHKAECMAKNMSKDITGQRFGKLTAIKWTGEYRGTNRVWLCKCDCGEYREVDINTLPQNGVKSSKKCVKYPYKDLKNQRFGKLIALEPTDKRADNKVVWKCKCDCGNICYVSSTHLSNGDTKSCGCLGKSYGEWIISNFLTSKNVFFYQEYKFNDCINPKTNQKLRFDFYLPDYNCCIEYDGRQHFFSRNSGWDTEQNTQIIKYRDSIKNNYCEENKINLIRVPYFIPEKDIPHFLEKELYDRKISFSNLQADAN